MKYNYFLFILIAFFVNNCAHTQPKKHPSKLVTVSLMGNNQSDKFMFLNKEVRHQSTAGIGLFKNTIYYSLLPGKYLLVATGNGGQYYKHVNKGLKMKNMGITEYRIGGFKKPNNKNGKWKLWSTPNKMASVAGILVPTGTNKKTFVERIDIKDISKYLKTIK